MHPTLGRTAALLGVCIVLLNTAVAVSPALASPASGDSVPVPEPADGRDEATADDERADSGESADGSEGAGSEESSGGDAAQDSDESGDDDAEEGSEEGSGAEDSAGRGDDDANEDSEESAEAKNSDGNGDDDVEEGSGGGTEDTDSSGEDDTEEGSREGAEEHSDRTDEEGADETASDAPDRGSEEADDTSEEPGGDREGDAPEEGPERSAETESEGGTSDGEERAGQDSAEEESNDEDSDGDAAGGFDVGTGSEESTAGGGTDDDDTVADDGADVAEESIENAAETATGGTTPGDDDGREVAAESPADGTQERPDSDRSGSDDDRRSGEPEPSSTGAGDSDEGTHEGETPGLTEETEDSGGNAETDAGNAPVDDGGAGGEPVEAVVAAVEAPTESSSPDQDDPATRSVDGAPVDRRPVADGGDSGTADSTEVGTGPPSATAAAGVDESDGIDPPAHGEAPRREADTHGEPTAVDDAGMDATVRAVSSSGDAAGTDGPALVREATGAVDTAGAELTESAPNAPVPEGSDEVTAELRGTDADGPAAVDITRAVVREDLERTATEGGELADSALVVAGEGVTSVRSSAAETVEPIRSTTAEGVDSDGRVGQVLETTSASSMLEPATTAGGADSDAQIGQVVEAAPTSSVLEPATGMVEREALGDPLTTDAVGTIHRTTSGVLASGEEGTGGAVDSITRDDADGADPVDGGNTIVLDRTVRVVETVGAGDATETAGANDAVEDIGHTAATAGRTGPGDDLVDPRGSAVGAPAVAPATDRTEGVDTHREEAAGASAARARTTASGGAAIGPGPSSPATREGRTASEPPTDVAGPSERREGVHYETSTDSTASRAVGATGDATLESRRSPGDGPGTVTGPVPADRTGSQPFSPVPSAVGAIGVVAIVAAVAGGYEAVSSLAIGGYGSALRVQVRTVAGAARGWIGRLPRVVPFPGYSRYDDSDPLENERRADVYGSIVDSPGAYLTRISDDLDIPRSTVRYHARVLEHEGLVTAESIWGRRRLFPVEVGSAELAAALSNDATGNVLRAVARNEPASVTALAEALDRSPSTVSHHLDRLEDAELIARERDGRSTSTRLAPAARKAFELDDGTATSPRTALSRVPSTD